MYYDKSSSSKYLAKSQDFFNGIANKAKGLGIPYAIYKLSPYQWVITLANERYSYSNDGITAQWEFEGIIN